MFDRLLEGQDLTQVFIVTVMIAVFSSLYLAQVAWRSDSEAGVPHLLALARRASATFMSLMLLWAVYFGYSKGWQPWPPLIGILIALDFHNIVRIAYHAFQERCREERSSGADSPYHWPAPLP